MKAYRIRKSDRVTLYVSEKRGDGGVDWGWTDDPKKAIDLSPYWMRRFKHDTEFCGGKAVFY